MPVATWQGGRATRGRAWRCVAEAAAVLLAYTLVAVFATWPLARHPLGGFYGFGNDNWGGIWIYGWLHDAYLGPESAAFSDELEVPFGHHLPLEAVQPLDSLFALLFGGPGSGLAAYNLQIFLSFVLAGCTMYLLGRYLTGSRLAALVAGFVYTFSPFHLAQAMQYPALASIQWLPLYLLALLVLFERRRLRDAALLGVTAALVAATSYYHAWFVSWFTLLLGAGCAGVLLWRRRRAVAAAPFSVLGRAAAWVASRAGVALLVAGVLGGPFVARSLTSAAESETVIHPVTEAIRYSGRPWMLFVPPLDNPLLGRQVREWVLVHLYDHPVYEQSMYVGYGVLALVIVGLWRSRRTSLMSIRERSARLLLAGGSLAGLLIVMGPYLPLDLEYWKLWSRPEETLHFPSLGLVMFELAPVFRFFSRAYVLVSLCVAGLAAIGFARVERRLPPVPGARASLAAVAIFLIGLEFTNAPPHVWLASDRPAWVNAVAQLPQGAAVVDYPVASLNSPRSLYYIFWQREHGHPTVNPPDSPAAQAFAATIVSPDDPAAGEALHEAGIDFAIVHTSLPPLTTPPYQPLLPPDSMDARAGSANPWFEEVGRTTDAVIYRIVEPALTGS